MIGTLGAVLTYMFNLFEGNWLLGKEGREFIEQPKWVKVGIVVAALMFLYNVTMTVLKGKKTAITGILLLGLWGWRCCSCSPSTTHRTWRWTSSTGGTSCTSGSKGCGS